MWRTCGLRPSARAARCSTPKRCCSSTTATARSANSTSRWISACVPTAIPTSPEATSWCAARRSRAVMLDVRSATRTPSSAQRPSIVRKCCSASVSVGAMSAPWRPASTARSSVYSATAVFPEPTSPCRRRCIGVEPREVVVDLVDRVLLGRRECEGQHVPVPGREVGGRRERFGHELLPRPGTTPEGELEREQLVERQPAPGAFRVVLATGPVEADERVGAERQGVAARGRPPGAARRRRGRRRAPRRSASGASSARGRRSTGRPARSQPSPPRLPGRSSRPGSRTGSASRASGRACRA